MSLPSKDDWILKEFTEPLTSSGAKPRTSCPKIFVVRCPLSEVIVGIGTSFGSTIRLPGHARHRDGPTREESHGLSRN